MCGSWVYRNSRAFICQQSSAMASCFKLSTILLQWSCQRCFVGVYETSRICISSHSVETTGVLPTNFLTLFIEMVCNSTLQSILNRGEISHRKHVCVCACVCVCVCGILADWDDALCGGVVVCELTRPYYTSNTQHCGSPTYRGCVWA